MRLTEIGWESEPEDWARGAVLRRPLGNWQAALDAVRERYDHDRRVAYVSVVAGLECAEAWFYGCAAPVVLPDMTSFVGYGSDVSYPFIQSRTP